MSLHEAHHFLGGGMRSVRSVMPEWFVAMDSNRDGFIELEELDQDSA